MKKKAPKSVSDILSDLKSSTDLGKQFERSIIWTRWPEIAGPQLTPHGVPHGLKDNVLYLAVDSTVWMHKFAYRKWNLIKKINRLAGRELVSDLFILLAEDEPSPPSQDGV